MKTTPSRLVINPYSDDDAAIRKLAITTQIIILVVVLALIPLVVTPAAMVIMAGILSVSILITWRGLVWPGQIITPIAIAATSTFFMLTNYGTHDIAILGLAGAVVVAGLFLGEQGTIVATVGTVFIVLAIGVAEQVGAFIPVPPSTHQAARDIGTVIFILAAIGLSLRVTLNRLKFIAIKARDNEAAQKQANQELIQLKNTLESRINERTADLERRASQLEAISKVSRSILNIQDLERLLPAITTVVSEQFGFYHTGIFLLDERSEFAVLAAANSEGGQRMLKRGHRLHLGTGGIVGYVAAHGEARIALDVGADSAFFKNPDLPNTRSEMALPLKTGNNVIGVLDVQSTETNAFQPEDISVLTTLANQVAIAIENSRLFSQTRKALVDSQSVYDEYIKREWSHFRQRIGQIGFTFDGIRTLPASTNNASDPNARHISIKIRGVTVGTITIRSNDPGRVWSQDEINMAQAAAERAGLVIENIRLLEEAQRRAAKERTIGEISSRIASTVDMNDIMRIAVEELGRAMPGSEVILQLEEKG